MGTEQTTAATEEVSAARRAELASRLAAVRQRIADACAAAGRERRRGRADGRHQDRVRRRTSPRCSTSGSTCSGRTGCRRPRARSKRSPPSVRRPDPGGTSSADCSGTRHGPSARWAEQVESVDSVRLADALDVAVRRTRGHRRARVVTLRACAVQCRRRPAARRCAPFGPAPAGRARRRLRRAAVWRGSWPSRRSAPTPRPPSPTSPTAAAGCGPPIRRRPSCRPV